jgi:hypothetical protein
VQKHFLILERIHGELAWEHEATKLKANQPHMFTKPPATHCRTSMSRRREPAQMRAISPWVTIFFSLLAFSLIDSLIGTVTRTGM